LEYKYPEKIEPGPQKYIVQHSFLSHKEKFDSIPEIIAVFPFCCSFYTINGKTLMIINPGLIKKMYWMM
jgi:hypothetical protein